MAAADRSHVLTYTSLFFLGMLVFLSFFPGKPSGFGIPPVSSPAPALSLSSAPEHNPLVSVKKAVLVEDCLHAGGIVLSSAKGIPSFTCAHDAASLRIVSAFFPGALLSFHAVPVFPGRLFSFMSILRPVSPFSPVVSPPPDPLPV
ncbi:MAG: hypothetical protein ACYCRD_08205 [Leptospirillum sp.]